MTQYTIKEVFSDQRGPGVCLMEDDRTTDEKLQFLFDAPDFSDHYNAWVGHSSGPGKRNQSRLWETLAIFYKFSPKNKNLALQLLESPGLIIRDHAPCISVLHLFSLADKEDKELAFGILTRKMRELISAPYGQYESLEHFYDFLFRTAYENEEGARSEVYKLAQNLIDDVLTHRDQEQYFTFLKKQLFVVERVRPEEDEEDFLSSFDEVFYDKLTRIMERKDRNPGWISYLAIFLENERFKEKAEKYFPLIVRELCGQAEEEYDEQLIHPRSEEILELIVLAAKDPRFIELFLNALQNNTHGLKNFVMSLESPSLALSCLATLASVADEAKAEGFIALYHVKFCLPNSLYRYPASNPLFKETIIGHYLIDKGNEHSHHAMMRCGLVTIELIQSKKMDRIIKEGRKQEFDIVTSLKHWLVSEITRSNFGRFSPHYIFQGEFSDKLLKNILDKASPLRQFMDMQRGSVQSKQTDSTAHLLKEAGKRRIRVESAATSTSLSNNPNSLHGASTSGQAPGSDIELQSLKRMT